MRLRNGPYYVDIGDTVVETPATWSGQALIEPDEAAKARAVLDQMSRQADQNVRATQWWAQHGR